ncbi:tryptophan-rich sensory protein [Bradyrhizobium sp. JYMT SZCCT0428]|nr:tryptophan-rich sensory protein [Bradyrhizobium sp. JYMT SZCCT0428]
MTSMMRLTVFVAFVIGGGFLIGYLNVPGSWYAGLNKPWFNPPNWIFAPVWAAIYLLVAIPGWRTWERHRKEMAMLLWLVQMVLNFLWSPIFFFAHLPGVALAIILALFVVILAFIVRQWNLDRLSSVIFVPYAAWVGFASLLNLSIVGLN